MSDRDLVDHAAFKSAAVKEIEGMRRCLATLAKKLEPFPGGTS
ncbi:MAG TPA: hypothetical protein VMZ92_04370 [Planctomycetota bacterium]|nr:hypothetical protein [Planctomycetota bacterium]